MMFYAKGREASDNLYTVYTAHPLSPLPYLPPYPCVCIVPEREGSHSTSENEKKQNKNNTCSASRGSFDQTGEPNPKEQNK